jgi:hypothetical protein
VAPIRDDLVSQLTALARQGMAPSRIIRHLSEQLPPTPAHKLTLIKYMRAAFGLTLEQASPIAGWADGGELTDAQLDALLAPDMLDTRGQWDR